MPSGKRSREQRKAPVPPPVGSKRGAATPRRVSRRTLLIAVAVIVLAGLGIGLGVGLGSGSSKSTTGPVDFAKLAGLQNVDPPWNNSLANLQQNLVFLHLSPLTAEGTVLHIHPHLEVYVNGKRVAVPSGIGIFGSEFLTEIHTHDTTGVIHVESPTQATFKLGQVFGEWDVRLSSNCLGYYCGQLRWWVNGKPQTGNPADLALSNHQVIVVAFGKPPAKIPSTYNFTAHGA